MRDSMKTYLMSAAMVLALTPTGGLVLAQDPGIPDTLRIDSAVAHTGGSGELPVYFTNDQSLTGVEVTVSWDSPEVTVDSFSFVGGRLAGYTSTGWATIDSGLSIYFIAFEDLIPPGEGLLGTIHFGYLSTIDPQLVTVDTATIFAPQVEYSTLFSDDFHEPFSPQVVKGYLDILAGGCCIGDRGNIDNSPDDAVDISDLVYLIDYMFVSGPAPVCPGEANLDGDPEEIIDISDLVYLVDYMFQDGPPPPPCYQ